MVKEIYSDDFIRVTDHSLDGLVAVQVGRPPEEATPALTNSADLAQALVGHSSEVESIEEVK